MTYAIIRLGGKQFNVKKGEKIKLERQDNPVVDIVLFSDGGNIAVGDPVLSDMWYFDINEETWSEISYTSTNITSLNLVYSILIGVVTLSFYLVRFSKKNRPN